MPPHSEAAGAGEGVSPATNSGSAEGDSVLDGITVVGCAAEGTVAVPQTVDSPRIGRDTGKILSTLSPGRVIGFTLAER